jgi:hypothetical protein
MALGRTVSEEIGTSDPDENGATGATPNTHP